MRWGATGDLRRVSAELAAYGTGREVGGVHVHVILAGVLANGLDQRPVNAAHAAAGDTIGVRGAEAHDDWTRIANRGDVYVRRRRRQGHVLDLNRPANGACAL